MEKNIGITDSGKSSTTRTLDNLLSVSSLISGIKSYPIPSETKINHKDSHTSENIKFAAKNAAEEKRRRKNIKRLKEAIKSGVITHSIICDNCVHAINKVMWVDIVVADGKYHPEQYECPVMEDGYIDLDPFIRYCENKYGDFMSLMIDYNDFPKDMCESLKDLPYGEENCGMHCLLCNAIL
jgi:hypothetical protein